MPRGCLAHSGGETKEKKLKTIFSGVNYIFAIVLSTVAIIFALSAIPAFGNRALIVKSGSMEPTIKVGDLVVVQTGRSILGNRQITYKTGDIIAFKNAKSEKVMITHRIAGEEIKNGQTFYKTKGDANSEMDSWLVARKDILGKADTRLPYIGKLLSFVKSKYGFPLVIGLPAVLVILFEAVSIYKEVRRQKSLYRLQQPQQTFAHLRIIIPIFFSVLLIQSTFAYFSDTEQSLNNTIAAAQSFASPSPTPSPSPSTSPSPSPSPSASPQLANHLVINEVMFDPPNENACGSENAAAWVEIYNPTTSSVNLDSWLIGDDNFTDDLPNVSLPAGGFAVVSDCTQNSFNSIWPLPGGTIYIDLSSTIGNGFNNAGEEIRLFNGAILIDNMSYGTNTDAFSPSVTPPATEHSMERDPDGVDTNTATDFIDRSTPTPGS